MLQGPVRVTEIGVEVRQLVEKVSVVYSYMQLLVIDVYHHISEDVLSNAAHH